MLYCLYIMSKRVQINFRADDEFVLAVGELQRLSGSPRPIPMSEAIREAVMEAVARKRAALSRAPSRGADR